MKLKVLLGTVRLSDKVAKAGDVFDIDEDQAKALLREKVVEEFKEEPKAENLVEAPQVEEKKPEVEKEAEPSTEPSDEWTRRELVEYAVSIGINDANDLGNKSNILKAIKEKGVKSDDKTN
jgi:hypothetical protein